MKKLALVTMVMVFLSPLFLSAQRGERNNRQRQGTEVSRRDNHRGTQITRQQPVSARTNHQRVRNATVRYNNSVYQYRNGHYYRSVNRRYVQVAPPIGMQVNFIPQGCVRVVVGNSAYFYLNGAFYQMHRRGHYVIVRPPIGAIVNYLPNGSEQVFVNGQMYFGFNGMLFQPLGRGAGFQVVGELFIG